MKGEKITLTRKDLEQAINYCEQIRGYFNMDLLWEVLKNKKYAKVVLENKNFEDTKKVFKINDYYVSVIPIHFNNMEHAIIKRKDQKPIHNWADIYLIKNKIFGEEREACEVYPAKSRLIDEDNVYHLFALEEGKKFDFGMKKT